MTAKMIASVMFYLAITVVTIVMASKIKTPIEYSFRDKLKHDQREEFLNRVYMMGIFVILFLCSAFRYRVGNDYVQYTDTAHEAFVDGYVVTEVGFNRLVKVIYTLAGGEYYEIVFAVFAFVTLAIFLKAMYEQSVDFSFTFFVFMTLGLYFQTYNTMRYYFALALALYSMRYVLEKDYIKFVFVILIAALFHKSVLIVLPLYILANMRWRMWQMVAGILLSAGCYFAKGTVLKLALFLYPSYNDTVFLEGGTSPISILRGLAILALYVWFVFRYIVENDNHSDDEKKSNCTKSSEDFLTRMNKTEKEKLKSRSKGLKISRARKNPEISPKVKHELRMYAQLNLLSVVVYIFFSFLPVITRIGYYLSVSQILMIPLLVQNIPEQRVKKFVKGIVVIGSVVYFAAFLWTARREGVGLLPYQSWLFTNERLTYDLK